MRDADLTPLRIDDSSILNQRVRVPLHAPFHATSHRQNKSKLSGRPGEQTPTRSDPFPHVVTMAKHGFHAASTRFGPKLWFTQVFPQKPGALAAFPYSLHNPLRWSPLLTCRDGSRTSPWRPNTSHCPPTPAPCWEGP